MSNTLKGILLALILIAALLVLLIVFTNEEPQTEEPGRTGSGGIILPPIEEPDDEEFEDDPVYIYTNGEHTEGVFYRGRLELPVFGATGWAATSTVLRSEASATSDRVTSLSPGDAFVIFDEDDDWWYVILPNEVSGWVEHRRCFINLPDVLPSIVYNISNAESSEFRSSGFDLPGITHNNLYSAYSYNERLERGEFIVPGSYILAQSLAAVQQLALSNGETLIIYEVFRPMATQRAVAASLNKLMDRNDAEYNEFVHRAIADSTWSVGSFISQGRSNHQMGAAVDVTVGIIEEREIVQTGDYSYHRVKYYSRIKEPSPMHELSPRAVLPNRNTAAGSDIGDGIWNMKSYFERLGFRALSSEWWHFNHPPSISAGSTAGVTGNFFTPVIYSIPPVR